MAIVHTSNKKWTNWSWGKSWAVSDQCWIVFVHKSQWLIHRINRFHSKHWISTELESYNSFWHYLWLEIIWVYMSAAVPRLNSGFPPHTPRFHVDPKNQIFIKLTESACVKQLKIWKIMKELHIIVRFCEFSMEMNNPSRKTTPTSAKCSRE